MPASSERKSSAGNSDRVHKDPETNSAVDHNQNLLKALQHFVVPLIMNTVDPKRQIDNKQSLMGPEAGKLISALQEFVSSLVVRSQSRAKNTIEVSLDEGDKLVNNLKDEGEHRNEDLSSEVDFISNPSSSSTERGTGSNNHSQNEDISEKVEPTFQDKLLSALREHVFNVMPIRLLCFETNRSSLQITLVERSTIHEHLESMLRANMHKPDHLPQNIINLGSEGPVMETEKEDEAIQRLISQYARYSILSHTWLHMSREVTYSDWIRGTFNAKEPGYQKLINFCKVSQKNHGVVYGWMDTICINKESSSELDESIRSMYNWYNRADVCIIYLGETESLLDMHIDPWFTRGWTLQELLAPAAVKFYNGNWEQLALYSDNDKRNAETVKQIERATSISHSELHDIRYAPISRRMQLAATRKVTREEDTAYSLMGIFNVSISTAYGEGADRAFFRLLQEILVSSEFVLDIFNWAGKIPRNRPHSSRLLPSSPKYYRGRSSNQNLTLGRPIEPLILTHMGVRVPVILMPAILVADTTSWKPIGDYSATINIRLFTYDMPVPAVTTTYNLLDSRISGPDHWTKDNGWYRLTFAVFDFHGDGTTIRIPKPCIAKVLYCEEDAGRVTSLGYVNSINTDAPVVFNLRKRTNVDGNDIEKFHTFSRGELGKHGMQLISLCL